MTSGAGRDDEGKTPPDAPLVEGRDYYFDPDGLWVLTEAYLRRRGYCCGSGCRHCPYNHESVPKKR